MREVELITPTGSTTASVPSPGDFDSFFVFAMHKSGSTLLNNMLSKILDAAGIAQMAIPDLAFMAGLPGNEILNPQDVIFERGYCYRGYRSFPEYLHRFDLSANKKILLIRDPRDMVVSFYFSCAQSHVVPEAGPMRDQLISQRKQAEQARIDEFCLANIADFIGEFKGYEHLLDSNLRIYRYEDVIFNKRSWLQDMLSYLQIAVAADLIHSVADENNIIPLNERPDQHIRQVYPGNFRKHLQPGTILELNAMLEPILRRYDYGTD